MTVYLCIDTQATQVPFPVPVIRSETLVHMVGKPYHLTCQTDSSIPSCFLSIKWLKNSRETGVTTTVYLETPTSTNDSATYTCVVTHGSEKRHSMPVRIKIIGNSPCSLHTVFYHCDCYVVYVTTPSSLLRHVLLTYFSLFVSILFYFFILRPFLCSYLDSNHDASRLVNSRKII